eukprot:2961835-Pleurochrysis_carterae.AAC.1
MHCVNAMATTRAFWRILAADQVVAERVTPQLVEGLDSQCKREGTLPQVCRIGDYRQELQTAFVLVELAG